MADFRMRAAERRHEPVVALLSPECVALPVSEMVGGDRRLEAGTYLSDGFMVRRKIRRSRPNVPLLGDLAKIWQPSRLKGIQVGPEHGVPFLAATQVFDIWPTPRKWLAPGRTRKLADRYVPPDCILVTCSGTVGNVMIAYSAHADVIISHDLLRVQISDPTLRSYVYAFLRTRFGRAMMRGSHYGNVIKHLEVAHLEQVPVPVLDGPLDDIHEQVAGAFAARDEAYLLDMASRAKFAEAMGDRPEPPREEGYPVPAQLLFDGRRRLDACAHSPSSQFVSRVYERNAKSVEPLGKTARAFVPGRFKRVFGEVGIPYLDSKPIFKINPDLTKLLTPATSIDFSAYMIRSGWLLMACSGQIYGINGQAIFANASHEGKVVTQHIMRIVPNPEKIRSAYLQTVLSHPALGQPLVVSRAYGTSVPELAPQDIEQLPIPRLAPWVENEIADAAERASELRLDADRKEDAAVSRLEVELERHLRVTPRGRTASPKHDVVRTRAIRRQAR